MTLGRFTYRCGEF